MSRFSCILVANRGEIACRVIRTARSLGYRTVAVYSEADRQAPHVRLADESVCVGDAPVNESYLRADRIIDAAKATGAGAIHPGYGFLSENPDFARACLEAGIIFIGPGADAIQLMGNKAEAKRRMIDAGVPCVPGYEGEDQSDETLLREAGGIELPLMVKAAAGGGGRGMRLVRDRDQLANAITLARAEALSAFGSDELILEKAIERPRHVEVQVFADASGNTVYLGERDCSVQRRHQKVIEEAPCPVMTESLRARMGEAAVAAARSINYRGAGTVEFLLASDGSFYFLEMNTRLQVEHPVTEMITGLDLVELQINVAQGEELGIQQEDVRLRGHAIEVRLYAEDTSRDFLPTSGPVHYWAPPRGEGVRVDSGIESRQEVSPFYDPMLAKIITHGASREIARMRMINALNSTLLFGTTTNRDFLLSCLKNNTFKAGEATTAMIEEEFPDDSLHGRRPGFRDNAIAAVIELELQCEQAYGESVFVSHTLKNWSSASPMSSRKRYDHGESTFDLWITAHGPRTYLVHDDEHSSELVVVDIDGDWAKLLIDEQQILAYWFRDQRALYMSIDGCSSVYEDTLKSEGMAEQGSGGGRVRAPMHGQLLEVKVSEGDSVEEGQTLAVLEAMKMFHEIVAETSGSVTEILAAPGTQVVADDLLIQIAVAGE